MLGLRAVEKMRLEGLCVSEWQSLTQVANALLPSLLVCTAVQWQEAKQYFADHFLDHAKASGLEDSVWLHLVKERRSVLLATCDREAATRSLAHPAPAPACATLGVRAFGCISLLLCM